MTGRALFVHLELDGNFAAQRRDTERHFELPLDVLSTFGPSATGSRPGATCTKHRAEDVAEATETPDIEILEGLAENDQIVTGPYQVLRTLKDNTRIKIEKAP